ncbi:MAG TPA: serine hydrolase domain-containing protein [Thermoanaerobaculia bacterium]|nr:serine hydrolase domain-containing protein [Thermoanaerobaculia bacterium]
MRTLAAAVLVALTLAHCGDAETVATETAAQPAPTTETTPETTPDIPIAESTTDLPAIDKLMRAYEGDVPGASVLVVHDGKIVVRRSYGLANLEEGTAATPKTNYRLASVTKQFTAAAILLLAERGRLQLDDPVKKWLPSLPDAADDITVRHLLTHTSGLADYEDLIDEESSRQLRDLDVLHLLEQEDRTDFTPGTQYSYSNSGYALLALIVERVSGERFATFVRDQLFRPLGMTGSVAWEEGRSEVPNRAYGYAKKKKNWKLADEDATSAILGDGGIYSSIDDLARWDAALTSGRLLSKQTLREALSGQVDTGDEETKYGFGWQITGDMVWHSGEMIGFRTVILRYPKQHLTVVVLTNRDEGEPYDLAEKIAEMFL